MLHNILPSIIFRQVLFHGTPIIELSVINDCDGYVGVGYYDIIGLMAEYVHASVRA